MQIWEFKAVTWQKGGFISKPNLLYNEKCMMDDSDLRAYLIEGKY